MTDLSKTSDCIDHNLLIAKFNAYGFEKQSVDFIYSYLAKGKQRMKVDSAISSWEMLFSGVPQGSVLGPLLVNIYTYIYTYIANKYRLCWIADDNTSYTYSSNIENVLDKEHQKKMFHWFSINHLVAIAGKCHLLTISKTPVDIHIFNTEILNEEKVK